MAHEPVFFDDENPNDLGEAAIENELYEQLDSAIDDISDLTLKCMKNLWRDQERQAAEHIALTCGWLDKCLDDLPKLDINFEQGNAHLTHEWKSLLEAEKESRSASLQQHAVPVSSQMNQNGNVAEIHPSNLEFVPNEVKILPGEYLTKNFKANQPEHQDYIDGCVDKY